MGLFSGLQKLLSKENVSDFVDYAEGLIAWYVSLKDLSGAEKKSRVDEACIIWLKNHAADLGTIANWVLTNLIIPIVPNVTQLVYNLLKKHVPELTKTTEAA